MVRDRLLDAIQLIAGLQLDLQCHSHCRRGRCGRPYEAQVPALIRLIAMFLPEPQDRQSGCQIAVQS